MEADAFWTAASNRALEVNLANTQRSSTTGVTSVGEHIETSTEPGRSIPLSTGSRVRETQVLIAQGQIGWGMEVGGNHSSDEASNDRGAKGCQIVTNGREALCPHTALVVLKLS